MQGGQPARGGCDGIRAAQLLAHARRRRSSGGRRFQVSIHNVASRATTANFGYFEDYSVGQVFEHHRGRTVSEMDNYLLTLLSLNTAAGHVDEQALGSQP